MGAALPMLADVRPKSWHFDASSSLPGPCMCFFSSPSEPRRSRVPMLPHPPCLVHVCFSPNFVAFLASSVKFRCCLLLLAWSLRVFLVTLSPGAIPLLGSLVTYATVVSWGCPLSFLLRVAQEPCYSCAKLSLSFTGACFGNRK